MTRRGGRAWQVTVPALVFAIAILVASCAPVVTPTPGPHASEPRSPSPSAPSPSAIATSPAPSLSPSPTEAWISTVTLADAKRCPVTKPRKAPASIGDLLFGSGVAFGNKSMWVGGLGEGGIIRADVRFREDDGWIGWKLGWWKIKSGSLTITGHRLDGPAPPLRSSVPSGYGLTGFQASGVSFPTEGCWQISGAIGDATLTVVTFVLRTP